MMPPMLYGMSMTGTGISFPLLRAAMPLSDMDHTNATYVSLSTLFGFFFFLCLLFDPSALQMHVSTTQSWYTAVISTQSTTLILGKRVHLPFDYGF